MKELLPLLVAANALAAGPDFNRDNKWDYKDWYDFQAVYSEQFPSDGFDSIDVNGDGSFFDPADLELFYKMWSRQPANESGWTPIEIDPSAVCLFFNPSTGSNSNSGTSMDKPLKEWDVARVYQIVGSPSIDEYRSGSVKRNVVIAFAYGTVHAGRINLEYGGVDFHRPVVITSYGDGSLGRPVVGGIGLQAECRGHVVISDIEVAGPDTGTTGAGILLQGGQEDVRIEGCYIHGWQNGVANTHPVTYFYIHRNVIADQWCQSALGHSQGFGPSQCQYVYVTENVFDQNGWAGKPEQRTKFNHSVYGVSNSRDMVFARNLVSRSSNTGLQLRANGQSAFDNVFYKNPANLTFGHDSTPPAVVPDGMAIGNIIVGTARNESWMAGSAIGINVCKGLRVTNTTIVGLPNEAQPNIRIEPTPASWGTNVSSFTVSGTKAMNLGTSAVFRTLGPNETIETPVNDPSLVRLSSIDWDALVSDARSGRRGDWRWSGVK